MPIPGLPRCFEGCLTSGFLRKALFLPLFLFLHSVDILASFRIVVEIFSLKNFKITILLSARFLYVLFFPIFFLWHFETGFYYVTQDSLELATFSPLPPECWDYGSVAPQPADFLLLKCSSFLCKSVICVYLFFCLLFLHVCSCS